MLRKHLLLLTISLVLALSLVWSPETDRDPAGIMTSRLRASLQADGPQVVWVYLRDKGLAGSDLEQALAAAAADLPPRTARRRAKVLPEGGRLVDGRDLPVHSDYLAAAEATGADLRQTSRWLNAASFRATAAQIEHLAGLDCVVGLDLVNRSAPSAVPEPVGAPVPLDLFSDSNKSSTDSGIDYGPNLAAMVQVNVPPLHDIGLRGKGVLVGMLDTGFRTVHEALDHLPVLGTYDFINNDTDVDNEGQDPVGSRNHGTMTLSTVAGNMPGSLVGPAPGVSVVLAKTEDISQEVPIEEDYWVAGLEWIESFGADIASSSLSYFDWYDYSDLDGNTAVTTIAADLAVGRGLIVVNSAGNSRTSTGTLGAPADGFQVITVGAVNSDGIVTGFSSPGPTPDGRIKPEVAALGLYNTVADPTNDTGYLSASGTSFSCPVTSGVVALMLERVPQLTPQQVIEALTMTASQAQTPDNDLGWGIVDAWAAATWFGPLIDHQPLPDTEDVIGPYAVNAVISDRVGVDPGTVVMHYRVNGGGWAAVPMAPAGPADTFTASIPGQPAFTAVEYYLEASGTNGFATALPYQGGECPILFTTGPWRVIDYTGTPAAPIPDGVGWGVTDLINVPITDSGFILEVSVDIDVSHPDRGELEVYLNSPDGTLVTLHDRSGAGTANLTGNWTTTLAVDGPGNLQDYLDLSNKGDWTLQVVDNIAGNAGTLNSWGLNFTLVRYVTPVNDSVPALATRLGPNVPNPFNPRTEISFDLARSGQTRLSIFDVRGMLVVQLLDENLPDGRHTAIWDGRDRSGRSVGSGTYFYRLENGPDIMARKMLLAR